MVRGYVGLNAYDRFSLVTRHSGRSCPAPPYPLGIAPSSPGTSMRAPTLRRSSTKSKMPQPGRTGSSAPEPVPRRPRAPFDKLDMDKDPDRALEGASPAVLAVAAAIASAACSELSAAMSSGRSELAPSRAVSRTWKAGSWSTN